MKIVHISDLHYKSKDDVDFDNFILEPLKKDIKKNDDTNIDFLIITGDLLDKGGKDEKSVESAYDEIALKIMDLSEHIGVELGRVIICPGNHDIARDSDNLPFDEQMDTVLKSNEEVKEYISKLDSCPEKMMQKLTLEKIKAYNIFERHFSSDNKVYSSMLSNVYKYDEVGIVVLNSAWRCFNETKDSDLILGLHQLIDCTNYLMDCKKRILVMHHDIDFFASFEANYIKSHILQNYNYVLTGHQHKSSQRKLIEKSGCTVFSTAPQLNPKNFLSDSKDYSNGYIQMMTNMKEDAITFKFRTYSFEHGAFIMNTKLSEDGESDKLTIEISSENKTKFNEYVDSCELKKERIINIANKKLVTYNSNSIAPHNFNELFVNPPLNEKVENDDENIEKKITIRDIMVSNDNIVIFSQKESGKTTLLYKLYFEYVQSMNSEVVIPVYINFNSSEFHRSANIDTYVANDWGLKIHDLRNNYIDAKFVLLIDNVKFEDGVSKTFKRLGQFLEKYNKSRVIFTSDATYSGEIPTDFFKANSLPDLRPLQLDYFGTNEIRILATKWNENNSYYEKESHVEKIVQMCEGINMCSSPLSVSMMLWIFENEIPKVGMNYANIIENFIEKTLSKHHESENYRDKYDYHNQLGALSKLAYRMYEVYGDYQTENKAMDYSFVLNELEEYLKVTSGTIAAKPLLDYFIDSGIFEYSGCDHNQVRFRYPCFYNYFIAIRMKNYPDFRTEVFSSNNYLKFMTEIDLYTSINRSDEKILELLIEKMENAYDGIVQEIYRSSETENVENKNQEIHPIDTLLEADKSIARMIKDEELSDMVSIRENIPEEKQEKIDKVRDKVLSKVNSENFERAEVVTKELSDIDILEGSMVLALIALRNLENIDSALMREKSLVKIIKCSVVFNVVYRTIIMDNLEQSIKNDKYKIRMLMMLLRMMPIIHEQSISGLLSSENVSKVAESIWELSEKKNKEEIFDFSLKSQFEIFMIYNLMAASNRFSSSTYYNSYIEQLRCNYILDSEFFKLMFKLKIADKDNKLERELLIDQMARLKFKMNPSIYLNNQQGIERSSDSIKRNEEYAISELKRTIKKNELKGDAHSRLFNESHNASVN